MSDQALSAPSQHLANVRIGRNHLAFFRGYLDGLPLLALASRYLEMPADIDLRVLKTYLKWTRNQLMITAKRSGRLFRDARLLSIGPEKFGSTTTAAPTLEEFRAFRDPDAVLGEMELLELYHDEYGGSVDRRAQRNARLRKRQKRILLELEQLVAADPRAGDGVGGWLEETVASRLESAGVQTLEQLIDVINRHGYRWWQQIPKLGEKRAERILDWLTSEYVKNSTGLAVRPAAMVPPRSTSSAVLLEGRKAAPTGIAPLETFALPGELETSKELVLEWLKLADPAGSTYRTYRKETERILLFSSLELGKPIFQLSSADCEKYRLFLDLLGQDPGSEWPFSIPANEWIGPRRAERWTEQWKPFTGKLKPASKALALSVAKLFFDWLLKNDHIASNPWRQGPPTTSLKP